MTKKKRREPIDLRNENPSGRLDVLAANLIEEIAKTHAPELLPIIEKHREQIHAGLNDLAGPQRLNMNEAIEEAKPYVPLVRTVMRHLASPHSRGTDSTS